MSDLPEHVKGEFPQLAPMSAEIEQLEDRLRELRGARQETINAEAQKVARFQVGYEYEDRKGQRFKITQVNGEYSYHPEYMKSPIIWVRYRGYRLFKKGTTGRTETLYPK